MNIEQAKEEQLKELFGIHKLCFQSHIEVVWGWDEDWQWNFFNEEWNNSEWRILTENETIIGYLVWTMKPDHLYLQNICFLPDHQGKGLGKSTMAYIEKLASDRSFPVKLSTFRTNDRVLKFYQDLGYKITEKVETGYRLSNEHKQAN